MGHGTSLATPHSTVSCRGLSLSLSLARSLLWRILEIVVSYELFCAGSTEAIQIPALAVYYMSRSVWVPGLATLIGDLLVLFDKSYTNASNAKR